jgi:hypothetical protein
VDGRTVRYLIAGEGPPLVLVHALGEFALALGRFLDETGRL